MRALVNVSWKVYTKSLSKMCPVKEDNNHEKTGELMFLCFLHSFAAFWCFIALTKYIWLSHKTLFPSLWEYHKSTRWHVMWQHIWFTKALKRPMKIITHILSYTIIYLVHPNLIFHLLSFLPIMCKALIRFQQKWSVLLTHVENLIWGSVLAN